MSKLMRKQSIECLVTKTNIVTKKLLNVTPKKRGWKMVSKCPLTEKSEFEYYGEQVNALNTKKIAK